jgi:hypothetical protein
MTTPRIVRFDWDDFAAFVAAKRAQHEARTHNEAVAVSLAAFKRWGVRPPPSFVQATGGAARRGTD